ncbi:MAG: SCO family protein [Gallionella sp.]
MTETTPTPRQSKSGLIILVILVALFILPEIIAVGLQTIKWRPKSTTNRGELVLPVRPIKDVDLQTIDSKAVKFSDFQHKWTMIYFADAECDEVCIKNIYSMRQVLKALGKEHERVRRIFVPTGAVSADMLKTKLQDYPGMIVVSGPSQNIHQLSQQFVQPGATSVDSGRIYLVDPLGNLMMSYRDDPSGMLKDLIHLMKTSSVG